MPTIFTGDLLAHTLDLEAQAQRSLEDLICGRTLFIRDTTVVGGIALSVSDAIAITERRLVFSTAAVVAMGALYVDDDRLRETTIRDQVIIQ